MSDHILSTEQQIAADRAALIEALGWLPNVMDDEKGREMVLHDARLLRPEMAKARERVAELECQIETSSPEYKQMQEDCWNEQSKQDRRLVRRGMWLAFVDACTDDDDKPNWFARHVWYPVKLNLCVILRLRPSEKRHGKSFQRDNVHVVTVHYAKLYAGWESDWLDVGRGVFRNWFYKLEHDGDWNM